MLQEHGVTRVERPEAPGQVDQGVSPTVRPRTGWCSSHTPWGPPMELACRPDGRAHEAVTPAQLRCPTSSGS